MFLHFTNGVEFVLTGLSDALELNAFAGKGAHVALANPDGIASKPTYQEEDGKLLQKLNNTLVLHLSRGW